MSNKYSNNIDLKGKQITSLPCSDTGSKVLVNSYFMVWSVSNVWRDSWSCGWMTYGPATAGVCWLWLRQGLGLFVQESAHGLCLGLPGVSSVPVGLGVWLRREKAAALVTRGRTTGVWDAGQSAHGEEKLFSTIPSSGLSDGWVNTLTQSWTHNSYLRADMAKCLSSSAMTKVTYL